MKQLLLIFLDQVQFWNVNQFQQYYFSQKSLSSEHFLDLQNCNLIQELLFQGKAKFISGIDKTDIKCDWISGSIIDGKTKAIL